MSVAGYSSAVRISVNLCAPPSDYLGQTKEMPRVKADAAALALDDQLLVVRCQLGERAAFDALVRRWAGPLHRYARRLADDADLARDLTQEVWLRAIQGLGRLRDAAQFRAWLFGIAHRVAMDRLRSRYAMPLESADTLDTLAAETDSGDEDIAHLASGLSLLPLAEREVLTLFYLEELPLTEIASVLAIPPGTVKSRLFRARHLLRQRLTTPENRHVR
jgi:RNA polymerase sigma-70 factor (ECF subfamily)